MMRPVFSLTFKVVAFILAFFAVFATSFVLLFLSFNRILLNPQTYKQAFTENKVYEQLPEVTAAEFALIRGQLVEPCTETVMADSCLDAVIHSSSTETSKLGTDGIAFINGLTQEQWNNLVRYLLTPDDIQKSLEAGIGDVIAFFKGETDAAGIPLSDLKEQLTRITSDELTAMLLSPQPLCTLDQQTLIMSAELSKVGSAPVFCSVTGGTSEVLLLDLRRRLNSVALELPEEVFLIEPPSPSNPRGLQMIIGKDLQATQQKLQTNAQYLPLLPVALLVLVTAFVVRSLKSFLRWWSIPIFIGSLFALILGVLIFFLFEQLWLSYVLKDFPPVLTSGFGEIIYSITQSVSKDVSQHLMTQAGIVALTALGILLISNHMPAPPDPSLPPLAPPGTPGGPVLNPNRKKKKR